MAQIFPTGENTSALNFGQLVTNVAYKLGVASYGSTGTGAPALPTDPFNLSICQTIVNDSIRMLIADGAGKWYWQDQTIQLDTFPNIGPDSTGSTYVKSTAYDAVNNLTTLTLTSPATPPANSTAFPTTFVPSFLQSMELRIIWLNGVPSTGFPGSLSFQGTVFGSTVGVPFTIVNYLSPTTVQISGTLSTGSVSTFVGSTHIPFSIATLGDFTLPADFGGAYTSEITWIAGTNRAVYIDWVDEATIRAQRQLYAFQFGIPSVASVRPIPLPTVAQMAITPTRPRWELNMWVSPSEYLSVNFSHMLSFNNLVNSTDLPPTPLSFDEVLLAAVRAQTERYQMDSIGGHDWEYYRTIALPNAQKLNTMAAPKKLGVMSNGGMKAGPRGLTDWRRRWYLRSNITQFPR
jgi:hypothetical protein